MDKYTVDLDQVLNDFEYSELTEHVSTSQQRRPRDGPVKHTINNVFQSLNEYISSDIGIQSRLNTLRKLSGQSELGYVDVYGRLCEVRSAAGEHSDAEASPDCDTLLDVEVETESQQSSTVVNQTNTIADKELVINQNEPASHHQPNLETEVTAQPDHFFIETTELLETNASQNADQICTAGETVAAETNDCANVEETNDEQEAAKTVDAQNEEQLIVETSDILNNNGAVETETSKADKAIGFDDSFVDETELNKYLDELEDELKDDEDNKSDEVEVAEAVQEDSDAVAEAVEVMVSSADPETDQDDNNSLSRPNSLQIHQIDLVGEPGSTPYNNMYVSKALPPTKEPSESDNESHSASPTFSDVSTDTVASTATTESVTDSVDDKSRPAPPPPPVETPTAEDVPDAEVPLDTGAGEAVVDVAQPQTEDAGPNSWLGKQAPLWIPDSEALNCLHCDTKFTVIKRRHHCRACGLVLCSKCCNARLRLEYLDAEARVCLRCHDILSNPGEASPSAGGSPARLAQPNPNNPMEYCSMVPPLQQVGSGSAQNPPTVMVPVGVLKRKGAVKTRTNKSVMFCDGIRPGSELTNLDNDFNYNEARPLTSVAAKPVAQPAVAKTNRNAPGTDPVTKTFVPSSDCSLPPTVAVYKSDITYTECANSPSVVEMLRNEPLTFALQSNLHVHLKIINMDCCINKQVWCFSTEGMISVGQDEVVILLELADGEQTVPKDVFWHLNNIYVDARRGTTITEYGVSLHPTTNLLDSKNHVGFLYIRPTFQCLQSVIIPKEPYLIGILIHRWEMPWAKIFPLRLVLRLGAEYRYYPSPIISTRQRESVFVEIGHTIINLLADFRNYSYTLPSIRGLSIHMEDKNTTVTIPSNRYEQVMKSLSNSSDHILAFGGNFSTNADSHLVCIQDTQGNNENTYTTHAINIQNRPRKVTGASFIVFNGALKSSSGLTAKSSIVEDGLMIQIPPEHMVQIRDSLRNMKNHTIQCGCVNAASDETVSVVWGENDVNFNVGVQSPIDGQSMAGVPSIRVHNGKDYACNSGARIIRWTEVFIVQNGEDNARAGQDVDFSKLAESIAKATCQALVKYLDLLSSNNFYKIGIRTTLHVENVSYCAGSNGIKLPPIYMKSLDNELIPVLHRITSNNLGESAIVLELVFRILNV